MSKQRLAATQVLTILQDLPSNCSGDDYSANETEEIVNSTVGRAGKFELSASDSCDDEPDPPA